MTNKSLITINNQPLSERDFMSAVENEIVTLHDTGDINRIMTVLEGIKQVEDVTGHAKAKLLFGANEWFKENCPDEVFSDHVESTTSIKKITVDRYVATWRYVENNTIPKEVATRPMRDLVPIASVLKQGYDISKDQWRKIDKCSNDGELREVLRKITGKKERKSARVIKLARDGSLYGWKDDKRYFLGYLNIKEAQDEVVIAEFLEIIKTKSGMVEE